VFSAEPEDGGTAGESKPGSESEPKTQFQYRLSCQDVKEIIQNIGILTILAVSNKNLRKSLHADLKAGDGTSITIDSDLKNHNEIKSMLSAIQSYISGSGYLTISSDIDLQKEFNDLDVTFSEI